LYADLEAFIYGYARYIRLFYRKGAKSNLARLRKSAEEIWEIQVRDPMPQTRALGRFALRDIFIAFFWKPHNELLTEAQYEAAKLRVSQEWIILFPSELPLSGVTVDDYISNGFPT